MKKRLLLAFVFLLVLPFVSSAVLNVPSNYSTIQFAIDSATAGDTINVSAGLYTEDLVIPEGKNNLELKGAGADLTTIKGVATINVTNWPIVAPNIEILSDNVKIHGFTIESPNYVSLTYSSGIVIGAQDVEIYNNNFIINSAGTDAEISQAIQTYSSGSLPGSDISGLVIQNNNFTHKSSGDWGYEAIYINPDEEAYSINIKENNFLGKIIRAITSERSNTNIENNKIITDMAILPDDWSSPGGYQGINIVKTGSQQNIKVLNNTISGSDSNKGFNQGINLGRTVQTFSNVNIKYNNIMYNKLGMLVKVADNVNINYNMIEQNIDFGIKNTDSNTLDAKYNYWGACDGPSGAGIGSGDNVSANVDYTPWIGTCIEQKSEGSNCILETENVTLYTNITGYCIGDVIFSISLDGAWTNHTGTPAVGIGNYKYTVDNLLLNGSKTIYWTVYTDDCYNHQEKDGLEDFYVNSKTTLIVNPPIPLGLNNWYLIPAIFDLINPDAVERLYRWNGDPSFNYPPSFGLENTPNNGNVTGGTHTLTYWSNIGCKNESEQSQTFYFDFQNPIIKDETPKENSLINNPHPTIYAYIDEKYQGNSGINLSTVKMFVDDIEEVSATVTRAGLIDAEVEFIPANLAEGTHNVTVQATDNAGRSSERIWEFEVSSFASLEININSPLENQIYSESKIQLNISLNDSVKEIMYIDYSDSRPRWRRLCRDCSEYGLYRLRTKILMKLTTP